MGHLIVVVGLPGSGKSTYVRARAQELREDGASMGVVAEDYMSNALGNRPELAASRHLSQLRDDLLGDKACVIADIAFTEGSKRRDLMSTLADLPSVCIEWVFFTHDPEQCRRNIEHDHHGKGRNLERRLSELQSRAGGYAIPPGFTPHPVPDATSPPTA